MRIDLLTLFPEVCEPFLAASILGRAQQAGQVAIACHNIRDYSKDPHQKVDDRPYGGGPGMVMTCPPVFEAVEAVEKLDDRKAMRILLTPQGRRFDQRLAEDFSKRERLLLIAGHYEGFDERIRLGLSPLELSIGDYVLSGGEAAALVLVDAVVRLLPGALGDAESIAEESFSLTESGSVIRDSDADSDIYLLEYPHYTRPREYRGMEVPEVLINGDHGKIEAWRRAQAMQRTKERRPDLLAGTQPKAHKEIRR